MGSTVNAATISADSGPLVQEVERAIKSLGQLSDKLKGTGDAAEDSGRKVEEATKRYGEFGYTFEGLIERMERYLEFEVVREGIISVIESTEEWEQSLNRLSAMADIASSHIGLTVNQLGMLSTDISEKTLFKEEDVQRAEAALMTFQHLGGDAFEKTVKLSADLAAVWGGDMASAARLLGRALDDPAHGMEMLRRDGITLSDAQERHIKLLQEEGKLEQAQAELLDIVGQKLGGVAEKMNKGLSESAHTASEAWEHLKTTIGQNPVFKFLTTEPLEGWSLLLSGTLPNPPSSQNAAINAQLDEVEKRVDKYRKIIAGQGGLFYGHGRQALVKDDEAGALSDKMITAGEAYDRAEALRESLVGQLAAQGKLEAATDRNAAATRKKQEADDQAHAHDAERQSALRELLKSYDDEYAKLTMNAKAYDEYRLQQALTKDSTREVTTEEVRAAEARVESFKAVKAEAKSIGDEFFSIEKAISKAHAEQEKFIKAQEQIGNERMKGLVDSAKKGIDGWQKTVDSQANKSADAWQKAIGMKGGMTDDWNHLLKMDAFHQTMTDIDTTMESVFGGALRGRLSDITDAFRSFFGDLEHIIVQYLASAAYQGLIHSSFFNTVTSLLGLGNAYTGDPAGVDTTMPAISITPGAPTPILPISTIGGASGARGAGGMAVHLTMPVTVQSLDPAQAYNVLQAHAPVIGAIAVDSIMKSRTALSAIAGNNR